MLEPTGLIGIILLLILVRVSNKPAACGNMTATEDGREVIAQKIAVELTRLIARLKAAQLISYPEALEENQQIAEELRELGCAIVIIDDDSLITVDQLYDLFDEARKESHQLERKLREVENEFLR